MKCPSSILILVLFPLGCDGNLSGGTPTDGPTQTGDRHFAEGFIPGGDGPGLLDGVPGVDSKTPPAPAQLPTFVQLDWAAFPKDPGPAYAVTGKTWVVKTTGSDSNPGTDASPLRHITAALSKASGGDKIVVHGGSYSESTTDDFRALVIKKALVLTAAAGATVTVTSSETYGIAIESSNVVVNGINLSGFTYGIQIGSSSGQKNVVISNLTITGQGDAEGIVAYDSGGSAVSDGLLIKNVKVKNAWLGISCNSGPCRSWRLENVLVDGGGGSGSGADAIAVENGDNFLFYGVETTGVAADGIDTKATRVVVWSCHVHNVERNGVKLWHGGDVVNTLIHHTGADASVVTETGPKTRLLHSVVAYHEKGGGSGYGMTFGYDSQANQAVELINTIVYNNNGGIYINGASTVKLENSLFFGIDNGMVVQTSAGDVYLSQGVAALAKFGAGNIIADPKVSSSFHLQSGSPGINKAKTLSTQYPTSDMAGNARVKGAAPDLGPYEDF